MPLPTETLYRYFITDLHVDFLRLFETSAGRQGLTEREWADLNPRHYDVIRQFTMQPGFYEFVRRLLSRALRFLRLRRCDCGEGMVHHHGRRLYYDPAEWVGDIYAREDMQALAMI